MTEQENALKTEEESKITPPQHNEEQKSSDNSQISPNLYQDILSLKEKNIYLLTESLEKKIPLILSYLMGKDDEFYPENKTKVLLYLKELFKKVDFYSEIFLRKKSLKEKLNIFEIIINQYITNTSQEYLSELKNLYILLLNKITLDKKTYKYIFSFFVDYLNKKNELQLTSENVSKILELITLYYASIPKIIQENDYMYFNTISNSDDYLIKIQTKKNNILSNKKINFDDSSLNILLFIKLVPQEIIKSVEVEHTPGLLELDFVDKAKNITFNIDNENNLIMNNNTTDKITKLEEDKYFNILFRFNVEMKEFKVEIFINSKKIEFKNSQIEIKGKETDKAKLREKYELNSINLFKNCVGQCTNIILFKNKKTEGLPKFFTGKQVKATSMAAFFDKSEAKDESEEIIKNNILEKGLYNEDLLNILLKGELKNKVELDNIFKNKPKDNTPIDDIEDFLKKIISIYIPSRNDMVNSEIVLKDSISGYDALFNHKNKESNLNGIHINKILIEDFNNMGGLNHFIPIVEIMVNDTNILTSKNLGLFLTMINTIINLYFIKVIKEEKNSHFFSNLSLFFRKIPDKYFTSEIVHNIVTLSSKLLGQISDDDIIELNQDFQNYILFEEKLLFKFKEEDQKKIIDQMIAVLNRFYTNKMDFVNIDIMKIANIMLYYDKDHLSKFCCKAHADYFNDSNKKKEIMQPELSELFQKLEYALRIICEKFSEEYKKNVKTQYRTKTENDIISLFEILALGVSPCFQRSIIKIFIEFFNNNYNEANKYTNILNNIFDISLFVLKSSIFDNKIDIINFINLLLNIKFSLNSKIKGKDLLPAIKINGSYQAFMNNNILPFYLIPREEMNNIDKSKILQSFYLMAGVEYKYISITDTEKKLYTIYNKKKLSSLFLDLYYNIFQSFKSHPSVKINLDFLIKIGTKGDLKLVMKFLTDLNNDKNKIDEIMKNNSLFNYLLETYFHFFIIKETNYDKSKFISRFYYLNEDLTDLKNQVEEICNLSKTLINDILKYNLYKLDFVLTWGKYYYEISKCKSKITTELIEDFIFNILSELFKAKFKNKKFMYDKPIEPLYFINIVYEFISFFKLNVISTNNQEGIERKINLIHDPEIKNSLLSSFDTLLSNFDESQKKIKNEIKWKYYPFVKDVLQIFSLLWNIIMTEENDINKFIQNIKDNRNYYLGDFDILFEDMSTVQAEFEKQNITNRGIKLIYLLYHLLIQLNNLGGIKEDIEENLTIFRRFLTRVITGSLTISMKNIEKRRKAKWTKEFYQNVQNTVKTIFYYSLKFLYESIRKCNLILSKNSNDKDKDYYLCLKNYLYETLAFLLRLTNSVYRKTKKEEEEKAKNAGTLKGFFKKVKNLVIEEEGIKTTGLYSFYEKMYEILGLVNESDKTNFLDKIPPIDFKRTKQPIKENIIECINSFIEKAENKKLFIPKSNIINKDIEYDNKKLYPFIEYIKKRNLSLSFAIPLYDVLPNIEFDVDEKKNFILKKLILACDYFQKCPLDKNLEKNIQKINENINQKLLFNTIKSDMERKTASHIYIKLKKKLFSFLGVWSYEEYFYNKSKYEIKYKLVNHLTSDYTRVLFEPIINIDYYFPQFTKYNYDEMFRKDENVSTICNLTDLSFAVPEHKKPLINEDDEKSNKKERVKKEEEKKEEVKKEEEKKEEEKKEEEKKEEEKTEEEKKDENKIEEEKKEEEKKEDVKKEDDKIEEEKKEEEKKEEEKKEEVKKEEEKKEEEKKEEVKKEEVKKDENKIEEEKTEIKEKKESTKVYNELYDVKLNYYKNLENITSNQDISSTDISEEQIKDFIIQKYSINVLTQLDVHAEACLVNEAVHITGLLFNDERGIGFYGYEKIHTSEIFEENYDKERFTCFGSIFRPQNKKYENYYINIPYNSIELVLRRRYFYRRNALEIFTVDKKSYLFNINENKFKSFYENIKHYMAKSIEDIIIDKYKVGFYKTQTFLKLNKSFIPFQNREKDMSLKAIYENWSKWKISTFKLLMLLNLYSSRSFHDLNQYPVFPWIITDFASNKLSLSDNNVMRALDTPMGMMDFTPESQDRKKSYMDTWKTEKEDEEQEEESTADRYRSHYSTSLYVTYYLVRVFPFSYIRVELQGKSFDDPNRLFNSMKSSFNNSITQKSDLRELIPEFFYFPEMFFNSNKLNLGMVITKEGEKLCNDVAVPDWADGNAYVFISKHKELLESPEISENINNWIDIIFGYKQKGKEAKKIYNLFAIESYEDYEEIYQKSNKNEKFLLCKFLEFGVTPSQLYKNAFNKRMAYSELKFNKYILPNTTQFLKKNDSGNSLDKLKELTVEEIKLPIYGIPSKIFYSEKRGKYQKLKYLIMALTQENIKIHKRKKKKIQIKKSFALTPTNQPQSATSTPTSSPNIPSEEEKFIIEMSIKNKGEIKLTSPQNRINNPPSVVFNNGNIIAFGGYWNGTIMAQNIEQRNDEKRLKIKRDILLYTGVNSPIVKMAIGKNETFAVCGNVIGNVFIFIINQNNKLEWTLYKKIAEHRAEITCLDINEDLNLCISCFKDGYWFTHSLPDCSLINSFIFTESLFNPDNKENKDDKIYHPNIALISYSPLPSVILYFEERNSLCVFSINGKLLKEQKMEFKLKENHIKKYRDMQFNEYLLIFNEIKQCIEIYNIIDLKSLASLPSIEHTFVDFIPGKDLDHIIILVQFKSKNEEKNTGQINSKTACKILLIRNNNLEIEWR